MVRRILKKRNVDKWKKTADIFTQIHIFTKIIKKEKKNENFDRESFYLVNIKNGALLRLFYLCSQCCANSVHLCIRKSSINA